MAEELAKEIAHSTPELFLTLFVAVLNSREKTLRQVNAGHNTQYALRADGRLHLFDPTWRPPGLLPGGGYVEQCAALATGDSILIYTTACWKHRVEPVKSSAKRRLERSLASERESSLDRLIARAESAVCDHQAAAEASDDATILVAKVQESVGEHPAELQGVHATN